MSIQLVDDNEPVLLLDGVEREVDYDTIFLESQPYLDNPREIVLFNDLAIEDLDVGQQFLVEANVTILGTRMTAMYKSTRGL